MDSTMLNIFFFTWAGLEIKGWLHFFQRGIAGSVIILEKVLVRVQKILINLSVTQPVSRDAGV